MNKNTLSLTVLALSLVFSFALVSHASAATYYVATNGSDSSSGTLSSAFLTIQKCANIAVSGDTCYVRAGTYRETVTPTNSGVTFTPYNGESVTISGADVVSGWSAYSGSIYRAPVSWDMGKNMNQVFVDGQMMNEARWPNSGLEPSYPTKAFAQGGGLTGTAAYITDSRLTQPAGFWKGATIFQMGNRGWWAVTRSVTGYSPGRIDFDVGYTYPGGQVVDQTYMPGTGTHYFLVGALGALDTGGEWYKDSSSVYLWTPQGDNPSGHTIEVKRRQWAFDLSSRSSVTIKGINIFAAGIRTDSSSNNLLIDGINAKYVSHFLSNDYRDSRVTTARDRGGILLLGTNSTIQNCQVTYSAGAAVYLGGTGNKVTHCVMHDADYQASTDGLVRALGANNQITHNTMYNSGRDIIAHSNATGLKIMYNHMYNSTLQTQDGGITYSYGTNGGGTEIAYNLTHDVHVIPYHNRWAMGIYLDQGSSNYLIHHNVVWNVGASGDQVRGIWFDTNPNASSGNINAYNNTIWNTRGTGVATNCKGGCKVYNNLSDGTISGPDLKNNLTTSNPLFVNSAGNNFQLQSGSPAINYGIAIPGITDGYVGSAPDAGAYEYGATPWTAGANSSAVTTPPPTPTPTPPPTPTCPNLLNSSIAVPTNFGASFNWFTNAKELLMNVICSGSGGLGTSATANIGNGSNTQYIYKTGYVWKNNQWTLFNYSGSNMDSGGNWFIGSANHSLGTLDLTQKQSVLSYICDWNGTSWKCGCHDNTCSTGYWNLQQFK